MCYFKKCTILDNCMENFESIQWPLVHCREISTVYSVIDLCFVFYFYLFVYNFGFVYVIIMQMWTTTTKKRQNKPNRQINQTQRHLQSKKRIPFRVQRVNEIHVTLLFSFTSLVQTFSLKKKKQIALICAREQAKTVLSKRNHIQQTQIESVKLIFVIKAYSSKRDQGLTST